MPQEACIIAVDNSDYMRNGDFNPTRLQAQTEAVMMVCHAKRQANIENSIGLMAMASKEVLSTLTSDYNKLFPRLYTMQLKGNMEFCTSIRIAHLALKLRQARHQKMRIVAFVGSPIYEEESDLVALAKRLRKEKVSVDLVNFGEDETNTTKLQAFVDTLNGSDGTGSHLVTVPTGTALSQSLMSSPIVYSENGAPSMAAGMGYEMEGADDPDLLYALRVSLEDQRMRQEAESGAPAETIAPAGTTALAANQGTSEEAMLQQALAMSMQGGGSAAPAAPAPSARNVDFASMSEEEQIALALQMSLESAGMDTDEPPKPSEAATPAPTTNAEEQMDVEFLDDLVKEEEKKKK